jgi:hypothetical protein
MLRETVTVVWILPVRVAPAAGGRPGPGTCRWPQSAAVTPAAASVDGTQRECLLEGGTRHMSARYGHDAFFVNTVLAANSIGTQKRVAANFGAGGSNAPPRVALAHPTGTAPHNSARRHDTGVLIVGGFSSGTTADGP